MQEYREYLKYNLKYAGIWNIMEYNAHIPNIVDDFASDGPLGCMCECTHLVSLKFTCHMPSSLP